MATTRKDTGQIGGCASTWQPTTSHAQSAKRLLSSANSLQFDCGSVSAVDGTHYFFASWIHLQKRGIPDPRPGKCFTPQPMPCPGCLSTRVISVYAGLTTPFESLPFGILLPCRGASCKYFASLHPLSGTPQDRTRWPSFQRLSSSSPSTVNKYFVARRQRSLWDVVLSWASVTSASAPLSSCQLSSANLPCGS